MTETRRPPLPFPVSDPTAIFRYRDAVLAVDLLAAAITDLDLFTLVARESLDLDALCARLGLARRPADVMLTLFAAMGLLRRDGTRVRASLAAREFLTSDSPWRLRPYYESLRERPFCRSLLEVLRTDRPARWTGEDRAWEEKLADEEFARRSHSARSSSVSISPRFRSAMPAQRRTSSEASCRALCSSGTATRASEPSRESSSAASRRTPSFGQASDARRNAARLAAGEFASSRRMSVCKWTGGSPR